jgi:hypothetical protein
MHFAIPILDAGFEMLSVHLAYLTHKYSYLFCLRLIIIPLSSTANLLKSLNKT